MTKFLFVLFCHESLPLSSKRIRIWVFSHLPLWHASDGPSHLLPLLGKISSQQVIFLKAAIARNQIQTPSPPTTKPHPLNPLTMGPPPLYLLGTGWQCFDPCGIATWFCFVLLLVYSTRVYPLFYLISFVFSMIFFFSVMSFLLLDLYYFFMHSLLCFSFPLVWLFFPSCSSCC